MSENKKVNETENPILTDELTPVKKPRKPRKKLVDLDEGVIPVDSEANSKEVSSSEKKEQQRVHMPDESKEEPYRDEGPAVIPASTFPEKCRSFCEKQKPFWNQPLTIGKAVLIALIACVISTSVSCAGIAKVNTRLDSLENSSSLNAAYLNWIMSPFGAAEAQISSGRRLGITVQDDDSGVIVVGVEDGTSAAKRFRLGDVIVLCNGAPVKTADDILNIVQNLPDDENAVEFSVNRDGKIKTFQVALAK